MVSPSPSSKKPTIAAVLTGLLVAALGTYLASATPEAVPGTSSSGEAPAAHSGNAEAAASAPPSAAGAAASGVSASASGAVLANSSANAAANPSASPAADPALSTSAAHHQYTKPQAAAALMELPELKALSALIAKNSSGATHGALIEDDPAPRVVKGKRYWQFSFVENTPDAVQRWESFLVASDGDILIDDVTTDELLTLERWRKEKQPAKRSSAGG